MLLAMLIAVQTVAASGDWAAFDRGSACEAVSRSLLVPPRGQVQPRVAIVFDRIGQRHGELSVMLRRPARPGSTVLLTVGDQPFLLAGRGADAWSRGPAQQAAIVTAIRLSDVMRVEARDTSGRRMVDRYSLAGAPTAIDAAAAACLRKR